MLYPLELIKNEKIDMMLSEWLVLHPGSSHKERLEAACDASLIICYDVCHDACFLAGILDGVLFYHPTLTHPSITNSYKVYKKTQKQAVDLSVEIPEWYSAYVIFCDKFDCNKPQESQESIVETFLSAFSYIDTTNWLSPEVAFIDCNFYDE